jgi:phosphatidylglycerophosphate synthase
MSNLLLLCLGGAALLGLYLGTLFLRGTPKPTLSLVHGFLAFSGLAVLIVAIRGNPYIPNDPQPSRLGTVAAAFLAWALFSGLVGPLYREKSKRGREAILISHAAAGLTGVAVVLLWLSRQP